MKTILGYTDRLSVAPGETIEIKVSVEDGASTFDASFHRLYCTDDHPGGPGIESEQVNADAAGTYPARHQPIRVGSSVVVPLPEHARHFGRFSLQADVWPTLPTVKRLSILTPDWRAKLTPLSGPAEVVPVVNRGDPRGSA